MSNLPRQARDILEQHAVARDLPSEAANRLRAWMDGKGDAEVYSLGVPDLGRAAVPRYLFIAGLLVLAGVVTSALGMAFEAVPKNVALAGGLVAILGLGIGVLAIFGWLLTGGLQGLVRLTAARTPFFLWHDDAYLFAWQPTREPQLHCYAWRDIASLACHVTPPAIDQGRAYPLLDLHIRDHAGVSRHEHWEVLMDSNVVEAWCPKLYAAATRYTRKPTHESPSESGATVLLDP